VPAFAERLASQDTFKAHPGSAKGSIFLDRLTCVLRTRRLEPARGRQKGRHYRLVNAQQIQNQKFHPLKHFATEGTENTEGNSKFQITAISLCALCVLCGYSCGYRLKLRQWPFEFHSQDRPPRIQNPIVFDADGGEFGAA
jgi:hypothetical protein